MIVGIAKEIKTGENRVSMTPAGVELMRAAGHQVLVEGGAGIGSGFSDRDYRDAGAELLAGPDELYARAAMVLHVKEPQPEEYPLIRPGQILFTYFHLAASESLTRAMLASGAVCIAYETIESPDGGLPLLTPMSEVAGRMAAQEAARYLEKAQGGRGILMGGVPGVAPARVLILGGGVAGTQAALVAAGLGARVDLLDICLERLRRLVEILPKNCQVLASSPAAIRELVRRADVVIGAVLVHGARAPQLISRAMLRTMQPGSVLIDIAIDQGGCFETSRPTTHSDPVYSVDGILHYCVANMPAAVPLTSTVALTNATLPYVLKIADRGWQQATSTDHGLRAGLNVVAGQVVCPGVADAFGLPCHSPPP